MADIRGDNLGLPHGATSGAVIANKNKASEHINEKRDGPYWKSHQDSTWKTQTAEDEAEVRHQ